MPVLAPLGDLVGINKEAMVMAYQFGNGLTNFGLSYRRCIAGWVVYCAHWVWSVVKGHCAAVSGAVDS